MKRIWAWIMAAMLCGGCSDRNVDYYEHAQRYLGCGEYEMAAHVFDQLGEYRDAAAYSLYARALEALAAGDHALARTNMALVDPFKSSGLYLAYLDALALKESGALEDALAAFEALGTFAESAEMATALRTAIPLQQLARCEALVEAGAYDEALALLAQIPVSEASEALRESCRQGILRAQYDQACLLYQQKEYEAALAAFEALGEVLDAPARVTLCRSAMYRQAASTVPTLENAAQLMADFRALGDYLDSAEQLSALEARFDRTLALMAAELPRVQLGAYPVQESGEPGLLTWRVIAVEGTQAMLLCEQVIDAGSVATATDLPIDWGHAADAVTLRLPEAEEVSRLPEQLLRAQATPYAMAQGARHHADGAAWWWLADEAGEGRRQIVWYTGVLLPGGVEETETVVGVRPVAELDLAAYAITAGEGTAQEPYR